MEEVLRYADPKNGLNGLTHLSFLKVEYKHIDIVERLLKVPSIDVNKCNKKGWSPLYYARNYYLTDFIKLLEK